MKKLLLTFTIVLSIFQQSIAQEALNIFPTQGFCIGSPSTDDMPRFLRFVEEELAPRGVNTLILRVDYNYAYKSHPELRNDKTLTEAQVKELVALCKRFQIRLIPQINLLGHQSWAGDLEKLLQVYPQFDETPHVEMPENYEWPNDDGLYCKSYCPLHPEVHGVVFDLVDEICEVFEADAFHAGMDEVFYLGDDKCPRCSGRDKAELFAGEVTKISNHLQAKGRELWIWGDRLIDGKTTGIGMWEGSYNNTHRAIDMIPKSVVICDWHYERPDQTAVYFAMKGFRVLTCPWRNPKVGVEQVDDMVRFRSTATSIMQDRYQGMVQTVWSSAGAFMNEYYDKKRTRGENELSPSDCFREIYTKINELAATKD